MVQKPKSKRHSKRSRSYKDDSDASNESSDHDDYYRPRRFKGRTSKRRNAKKYLEDSDDYYSKSEESHSDADVVDDYNKKKKRYGYDYDRSSKSSSSYSGS